MRRLLFIALFALTACVSQNQMTRSAARVQLGVAQYREGDYGAAVATLREGAHLDPGSWRAWNALAIVYIAQGETELAEDAFDRALRVGGNEAEILNNRGTLYVRTGRMDEAIGAFELALRDLDYRNPAMIHSNMSYALLQAGRVDEALQSAREATRRAPTLCDGWYNLGLVQEARRDALSALDAYSQVRANCPKEDTAARLRIGCIQVEVGMDTGATLLQDIVRTAPNSAEGDEARACLSAHGLHADRGF